MGKTHYPRVSWEVLLRGFATRFARAVRCVAMNESEEEEVQDRRDEREGLERSLTSWVDGWMVRLGKSGCSEDTSTPLRPMYGVVVRMGLGLDLGLFCLAPYGAG